MAQTGEKPVDVENLIGVKTTTAALLERRSTAARLVSIVGNLTGLHRYRVLRTESAKRLEPTVTDQKLSPALEERSAGHCIHPCQVPGRGRNLRREPELPEEPCPVPGPRERLC